MKGSCAFTKTRRPPYARLLALLLVLGLGAGAALAGEPKVTKVADKSYLGAVKAGGHVAFVIKPASGQISVLETTVNTLDSQCEKAITRAPTWLQHQLREALRRMKAADQKQYAKVITEATDKTIDEIAFLVAHTSDEDLQYITPALIKRNAELIYEVDPLVKYADLVEYGEAKKGGDFYTTVKYTALQDGKETTFELVRDDYYWWVVHPLLDMEFITTIDPQKGTHAKPPSGVAWREYFLAKKGAKLSPGKHYIMRLPNVITDKDLATYDFGGSAAHASLRPSLVGPNEVIRAGKTDEPVLVQYSLSGGSCGANNPNPDGIYLVTTIPLEKAAAKGDTELLENLLMAGPARSTMRLKDTVTHATCDKDRVKETRDYLIVRDRVPFSAVKDPNEAVLTKAGRGYKVLTSVAFAKLMDDGMLTTAVKPFYNLKYNKIVVPSDQPRALYDTLAKYRKEIEAFVKYGGVFELHGATSEKDDWSDLTMPGGFKSTKQTLKNHLSTLSEYGNARLLDVVKDVKYLWTGVRRCSRFVDKSKCLKGDRLLKDSPDAIDRVGWWSSQMLDRSVSEYACLRGLGQSPNCATSAERSWYPQRIVPHHYGNCGEIQDVVGAASRAVLVPSMVTLSQEDHVWNEFYAGNDQWYPYDTGWSDTAMRIGDWSVSGDGSSGGGKENAAMLAWRGDGKMVNLLGRYKAKTVDKKIDYEYTAWLTVTITVVDANGKPVDGARVTLMTEWYYSAQKAVKAIFGITGRDGKVSLRVGDKRNFYINIASPLGHYPKPMSTGSYYVDRKEFELLVKKSEAVAEAKIARTFKLEGKDTAGAAHKALFFPSVKKGTWAAPKKDAAYHRLKLELSAPAEHHPQYNPMNRRTFVETAGKGKVDLYVTDRANYDKFKADKPFSAVVIKEGVEAAKGVSVELPDSAERVVIVSNRKLASFGQLVQASLTLEEVSPPTSTPPGTTPDDESEQGCSCAVGSAGAGSPLAALLLGLLLLAVGARRERILDLRREIGDNKDNK